MGFQNDVCTLRLSGRGPYLQSHKPPAPQSAQRKVVGYVPIPASQTPKTACGGSLQRGKSPFFANERGYAVLIFRLCGLYQTHLFAGVHFQDFLPVVPCDGAVGQVFHDF